MDGWGKWRVVGGVTLTPIAILLSDNIWYYERTNLFVQLDFLAQSESQYSITADKASK